MTNDSYSNSTTGSLSSELSLRAFSHSLIGQFSTGHQATRGMHPCGSPLTHPKPADKHSPAAVTSPPVDRAVTPRRLGGRQTTNHYKSYRFRDCGQEQRCREWEWVNVWGRYCQRCLTR